jgi:putative ABC transport system ATP-binding protein
MIEVRKLRKSYGGGALSQTVLQDVDLTVRSGEVLMLVGPSGSGKTTLLSILGCVLAPSSGSVQLAGHELMGVPQSALPMMRLRYIGFVFQSHNLLPSLSALDNVRLPLLLRGWSGQRATLESQLLLENVGLTGKMACLPSQLSGGQAQRVAIARALAGRPPIILADEPTAALDAHTGQGVMETLTQLAHDGGHTVVVVTHDNRIFRFGDRIVRIEDGRITEDTAHGHA